MECSLPGSSIWNFPGKSTGVSCHFLLQGVFPTRHCSNLGLPHCRQTLYHQSHHGSPLTQWTRVKASFGRWWRTGKPGVLQCMGFKELDTTQRMNINNKGVKLGYLFEIFFNVLICHCQLPSYQCFCCILEVLLFCGSIFIFFKISFHFPF